MRLNTRQRTEARHIILQGARKMLAHEPGIHYTQGGQRWEGLDKRLRIVKGQFPRHADCSSMVTWMLWNALTHALHDMTIPDVVNGQHWRAGYTGTLRQHGLDIRTPGLAGHMLVGDEVHYGGGTGHHVAIYIGGGFVFSHGSERGPWKLPWNYRGDFSHARRILLAPH